MKKTIKTKDVLEVESPDKVVETSYMLDDGKETKMMEITSIRKKK